MTGKEFLFETSWEVCNKVGGIHTVLMTKVPTMAEKFGNNYILIGPDLHSGQDVDSEFVQDDDKLPSWRQYCADNNIRIRIGHWNIKSEPMVILVDFSQYFAQKDKIFADYWEKYSVDSITGGWDYIEPFLFGYAAAKVVESYYNFYLDSDDRIVAHFHEWMTGSGVLYLKSYVPQVATLFTTHATVLGRCLAGNNIPLYTEMNNFVASRIAKDFNVTAKYSLESVTARQTDGFTTVSELTNNECKQFFEKPANIVTPNGFDEEFVPDTKNFNTIRERARKKIFTLAEQMTSHSYADDTFLIINSGRYEFKNKGIDVFIKAMSELNKVETQKKILAVIAVPAGKGAVKHDLYTTHQLENPNEDPILNAIKQSGICNTAQDNVNIIFIPSYLDGNDGVINLNYFDFLTAFDMSVFPSYYEPWGYTPMESMAFGIPSVTTTLSGFGLWVNDHIDNQYNALTVVKRDDYNTDECIAQIKQSVLDLVEADNDRIKQVKSAAVQIFKNVQWKEFSQYYLDAYDKALVKAFERFPLYKEKKPMGREVAPHGSWGRTPLWRKFLVKESLPSGLQPLNRLAQNLWWSWNYDAYELFCSIDKQKYLDLGRSPIRLLESLSKDDYDRLLNDKKFMSDMADVVKHFDEYLAQRQTKSNAPIAYFSMEFGLHDSLQIFSGGLGMLAGDYLKQASDSNSNIIGIGLLYRQGYFAQHISKDGNQHSERNTQKFSLLPIKAERDEEGNWRKIAINLPGRKVVAKIWRCDVGVTPLYLLDTDIDENNQEDRQITWQLYGGDNEMRLKQEILLGMGGIKLLENLNINPAIYHLNEGHSAFSSLERLKVYMNKYALNYDEAVAVIRASTLFTTHTPVAAGHDSFNEDLMRVYFSQYANALNISWDDFMLMGRKSNENRNDKFSVSVLALRFCSQVNGVSKIHGRVSREMFQYMYDGYFAPEINIGYVTNGVHQPTWAAKEWYDLDENYLQHTDRIDDEKIWQTHQKLKGQLIDFCKRRLKKELTLRGENPQLYVKTADSLKEDVLTIGFARRFATYKRANLLFTNLDRLETIVNKGVRFIFAGKAHPADIQGQDLIKNIIRISKLPQFAGKILFIENYDMYVAKHLIRGVDVWLNSPTREMEASGTSGEKAVMNGVVNFSVMDGWWAEGYTPEAGWALSEEKNYKDNDEQNQFDAEMIYSVIENEIIPAYYQKNEKGFSSEWVKYMKNTFKMIAPNFTMKRQLDDYFERYYNEMFKQTELMIGNDFANSRQYARWQRDMKRMFDVVEPLNIKVPDAESGIKNMGDKFTFVADVFTGEIDPKYIGIEIVVAYNNRIRTEEFTLKESDKKHCTSKYTLEVNWERSGVYDYAIRLFAKHPLMKTRMDLPLCKWL